MACTGTVKNRVLTVPSTAAPAFGASVARPPLQPADCVRSATVGAWLSPTAQQRSLPTNVRDVPASFNVNTLRSRRAPRFAEALPEGGASYDAAVCTDNFVEERRDPCYVSGTVPSLVRCQGLYKTEYRDRMAEAVPGYRAAVTVGGLVAAVPQAGQDYRNSRRVGYEGDYVHYSRQGFTRGGLHGDATVPGKQGAAWVGTAPCHMFESVQRTTQRGLKPEFQKIHPGADGKLKAVITCTPDAQPRPSPALDATRARFAASERNHAAHWQSMYATSICKAPRL